MTEHFSKILSDYDAFIRVRGYRITSGNMYHAAVKEFFTYLHQRGFGDITEVGKKELGIYADHLSKRTSKTGGTLSISSINHHLFALKLLFDVLLDSGILQSCVKIPSYYKASLNEKDTLTIEEVKLLFEHCINHRERAILSLAYGCGLRRSEIVALNISDINLRQGFLIVRQGKNNKRREIPLTETVSAYLSGYLTQERSNYVVRGRLLKSFLLNDAGGRMSGNTLAKRLQFIVRRFQKAHNIQKHITLHSLRHAIAEHLLGNGATIEFIKDFLGHSQIDTSQLYAIKQKRRS